MVCEREGVYELIDGFKRFSAARYLKPIPKLSSRLIEVDERGAKAAIYGLNRVGGRTRELEEVWIVHALVREDGLSQVEVAELLGRHKSWVCRRLALIEKLVPEAMEKLRLGLLCPSAARELIRLPVGNQKELLPVIRREALSVPELNRVVDVLLRASDRSQQAYVLQQPREALAQDEHAPLPAQDPRLSAAANMVFMRLGNYPIWYFMAGRGNHEKTIGQLKSGLAFHTVPTMAYAANSAWQQLVILTHNLLTNFQIETGAQRRRRSRKHTTLPVLKTVQTLRFVLFHRAAALVHPGGKPTLRLANNAATRRFYTRIEHVLDNTAWFFVRLGLTNPNLTEMLPVSNSKPA